jgi:hypothetical protein
MKVQCVLSIILLLCPILLCHGADGDSSWSLILKSSASQQARSVRQTSDGGFIIGITANVTREVPPGIRLVAVKTNRSGIVQWQKEYGRGNFIAIRQLKSGKYIALGEHPERIGTGVDSSMIIFMLDANGNIEWQQTTTVGVTPIGVEESPDESLFVYGYSSAYNGAVFLIKLQSDGEIVWQKVFGKYIGTISDAFRITADGEGFFAFAGPLQEHEYHVYKLSLDGKIIWKRFYKTSIFAASTFQSLELTKDGGFIISERLPLVSKYDKNGKSVWSKFFSTNTMAVVNSMVVDKNGNTLLVGQIGTVNGHPDLWLLKIDKSGNILWHKRAGKRFVDRGADVALTKDNHYIVAGQLGRGQFSGSNAWTLNLNQSGNVNDCDFTVNDVESQINDPQLMRLQPASEMQTANIQLQFSSASQGDWNTIPVFNCR